MATIDTATYGVRIREPDQDDAGLYAEEIRRVGFTVIPGVYQEAQMEQAAKCLDRLLDIQTEECGGPEAVGRARDSDLIRCPLAYDESMLAYACEPIVLEVSKRLLGESLVLLMQNAIINQPAKKQEQSRYHRDLNYQHWTSSRPLALNYLVCVDPFFEAGGSTWVLPGSHLQESFPSTRFVERHEVSLETNRGAIIMMDAMLFHRYWRQHDARPYQACDQSCRGRAPTGPADRPSSAVGFAWPRLLASRVAIGLPGLSMESRGRRAAVATQAQRRAVKLQS